MTLSAKWRIDILHKVAYNIYVFEVQGDLPILIRWWSNGWGFLCGHGRTVYAVDLKSTAHTGLWVRVPLSAHVPVYPNRKRSTAQTRKSGGSNPLTGTFLRKDKRKDFGKLEKRPYYRKTKSINWFNARWCRNEWRMHSYVQRNNKRRSSWLHWWISWQMQHWLGSRMFTWKCWW